MSRVVIGAAGGVLAGVLCGALAGAASPLLVLLGAGLLLVATGRLAGNPKDGALAGFIAGGAALPGLGYLLVFTPAHQLILDAGLLATDQATTLSLLGALLGYTFQAGALLPWGALFGGAALGALGGLIGSEPARAARAPLLLPALAGVFITSVAVLGSSAFLHTVGSTVEPDSTILPVLIGSGTLLCAALAAWGGYGLSRPRPRLWGGVSLVLLLLAGGVGLVALASGNTAAAALAPTAGCAAFFASGLAGERPEQPYTPAEAGVLTSWLLLLSVLCPLGLGAVVMGVGLLPHLEALTGRGDVPAPGAAEAVMATALLRMSGAVAACGLCWGSAVGLWRWLRPHKQVNTARASTPVEQQQRQRQQQRSVKALL